MCNRYRYHIFRYSWQLAAGAVNKASRVYRWGTKIRDAGNLIYSGVALTTFLPAEGICYALTGKFHVPGVSNATNFLPNMTETAIEVAKKIEKKTVGL